MGRKPKAATPAVEPSAADAPKKKAKATAREIVPVSSKAIQAGVGLQALQMVAQSVQNEAVISQLRRDNNDMMGVRGRAQVVVAMGLYQAALADETIRQDLPKTWLDPKKNRSDLIYLYSRLRVALGMEDLKGRQTEEVRQLAGDVSGDTEADAKRKESIRTKFAAILNKAAKVALDALDNGIKMEVDKTSGLLLLSDQKRGSGAVKERFGQPSVVLNEDQNVKVLDKKGKATGATMKLKALPSFTEIIRSAAKEHDVQYQTRTDARVQVLTTDKWITETCQRMITSVTHIDIEKASKEVKDALNSLYNALDKKLT